MMKQKGEIRMFLRAADIFNSYCKTNRKIGIYTLKAFSVCSYFFNAHVTINNNLKIHRSSLFETDFWKAAVMAAESENN